MEVRKDGIKKKVEEVDGYDHDHEQEDGQAEDQNENLSHHTDGGGPEPAADQPARRGEVLNGEQENTADDPPTDVNSGNLYATPSLSKGGVS